MRSKWTVEILTAIICGNTRFKDIITSVKGISEKVLTDRLRQMQDDRLIERELMQELLTFLELLTCDCELNTHHTSSMNLTAPTLWNIKSALSIINSNQVFFPFYLLCFR